MGAACWRRATVRSTLACLLGTLVARCLAACLFATARRPAPLRLLATEGQGLRECVMCSRQGLAEHDHGFLDSSQSQRGQRSRRNRRCVGARSAGG